MESAADERDAVNLNGLAGVRVRIVRVPRRTPVKVLMPSTLRRLVVEACRFTFLIRVPS